MLLHYKIVVTIAPHASHEPYITHHSRSKHAVCPVFICRLSRFFNVKLCVVITTGQVYLTRYGEIGSGFSFTSLLSHGDAVRDSRSQLFSVCLIKSLLGFRSYSAITVVLHWCATTIVTFSAICVLMSTSTSGFSKNV